MKKTIISLIIVAMIICGCVMSTACFPNEAKPQKLVMTTLSYNDANKTVSWAKVENASGYLLRVGNDEKSSNLITESGGKMNYVLTEAESGTYDIYVMALGDGQNYTNSDEIHISAAYTKAPVKLQMGEIAFDVITGIVSFAVVENAQGYVFKVNGILCDPVLNSTSGKMQYQFSVYDTYTVTIIALGDDVEWLDSDITTRNCEYVDPIVFDEIETIIANLAGECWKQGNPVIQSWYLYSEVFGVNILTDDAYVEIFTKTSGSDATPIKNVYILNLGRLPAAVSEVKTYLTSKTPSPSLLTPFGQGAALETDDNAVRLVSAFLNRAASLALQSSSDSQTVSKLSGITMDNVVKLFATQFTASNTNLWFMLEEGTIVSVLLGVTGLSASAITSDRKIDEFVGGASAVIKQITVQDYKRLGDSDSIDQNETDDSTIDLYLIGGQSNASGNSTFASSKTADLMKTYPGIMYAGETEHNITTNVPGTNSIDNFVEKVRAGLGQNATCIGPEYGMAEVLSEFYSNETPRKALIFKSSANGTALQNKYTSTNHKRYGNWYPASLWDSLPDSEKNAGTGKQYSLFVDNFKKVYNKLKNEGHIVKIKGMIWMQGEDDKGDPAIYKELIRTFINDLRTDLGKITNTDLSGMPFVAGEISETQGNSTQGVSATLTINRNFNAMLNSIEQEKLVTNFGVAHTGDLLINSLDWSEILGSDVHHWNADDMLEIGTRFAKKLLSL